MRNLLVVLSFVMLSFFVKSQGVIYYDNIEAWNWPGGWAVGFGNNTGFYSNAFVSSNLSAALVGTGTGNSNIEEGYYILPNVTGLDVNNTYTFSFRLGSYRFSSTGSASGTDVTDYITVSYSTNNGTSWSNEIRVTGNNNSYWSYNNNAYILKFANGVMSTYTPVGGGNRTTLNDGYSSVILELPSGINQCSFRIYCRANAAGEEWWLDNFELSETVALPVELLEFYGEKKSFVNHIKWKTASEFNSSHFVLQKSTTGFFDDNSSIAYIESAGNSVQIIEYEHFDSNPEKTINYYRLLQYDIDGKYKEYDIISIDNRTNRLITKRTDLFGREVDENYKGWILLQYSDGSLSKSFQ